MQIVILRTENINVAGVAGVLLEYAAGVVAARASDVRAMMSSVQLLQQLKTALGTSLDPTVRLANGRAREGQ
jgi:hypothetical protein